MSEPAWVYRFYDIAGTLLYVGATNNFGRRWSQHATAKAWWPQVATRTVQWYPDRDLALAIEKQAIRAERPLHNIVGTSRNFKPTRPQVAPAAFGSYVGAAEIGRMLGVGRQRVQQIVTGGGFPEPCKVLAMGKVWLTDDVVDWALEIGRVSTAA